MNESETEHPKTVLRELTAEPDSTRSPIRYRLTEGLVDGRPSYDITCQAEEGWYENEVVLVDVTSEREQAERLLTDLQQGGVTPYALGETVEEWLLLL